LGASSTLCGTIGASSCALLVSFLVFFSLGGETILLGM